MDLTKYYEDIIKKANELIEQKKYDEAIFILEDELDAPYIPVEFLTQLEDLLIFANAEKNYFEGLSNVESFSRDKLLRQIYCDNKFDTSALMLFFERYANSITDKELNFFENIFVNREVDNQNKTMLFETLSFYKIDVNVRFYNTWLKEEFSLNTLNTKIFEQIDLYKNAQKLINDMTSKEPSLTSFCSNILLIIYKNYFPVIPNFDFKELSKSIMNYMISALQGEKTEKNEITEIIEKIISQ